MHENALDYVLQISLQIAVDMRLKVCSSPWASHYDMGQGSFEQPLRCGVVLSDRRRERHVAASGAPRNSYLSINPFTLSLATYY